MKVYINNMIVKSKILDHHFLDLKETFNTLRRFRMKLILKSVLLGYLLAMGSMINERGIEANLENIKSILDMSSPRSMKEL